MANNAAAAQPAQDKAFIITRDFMAPRDLVWKAWTDPEMLAQWFGPRGCRIVKSAMQLKPGGIYHYGMEMPGGAVMWGKWTFKEIKKPEKLVTVVSFSDEKGGTTTHPMNAAWPRETLSEAAFEENKQGGTTLTLRWSALNATAQEQAAFDAGHEGMKLGWGGTMQQLDAFLAQAIKGSPRQGITLTRAYDSPAGKVFDAWLDPETAKNFLFATEGGVMQKTEIDAKVGGQFLIVEHRGNMEASHSGSYLVIDRPKKLSFSFFDTLVTITIAPRGKGCELTLLHEGVPEDYTAQSTQGWGVILDKLAAAIR